MRKRLSHRHPVAIEQSHRAACSIWRWTTSSSTRVFRTRGRSCLPMGEFRSRPTGWNVS